MLKLWAAGITVACVLAWGRRKRPTQRASVIVTTVAW
jgi:hypothetical protein